MEVYASDMFDDVWKPETSAKLRQALDHPELYPFIDVSQVNSRSFGEDHWDHFYWIVRQGAPHPRPLNNTKIYSDGETSWGSGTPKDGIERFWRNLIGGAASCRFHRPGGGIGLNEVAQACIRSARSVETLIKFWDVEPHMELLGDRERNEAYLSARPGEQYVLFFTDGGSVRLDLEKWDSTFLLRWMDVSSGAWGSEAKLTGNQSIVVSPPANGPWVAAIVKSGKP